jgi:hypothetical protein
MPDDVIDKARKYSRLVCIDNRCNCSHYLHNGHVGFDAIPVIDLLERKYDEWRKIQVWAILDTENQVK